MPLPESQAQSQIRPDWISARVHVRSNRGARLVLHRIDAVKVKCSSDKRPVILAHGTFSNHRTCSGLARFLAGRGHDCWLIDFEGHGSSKQTYPDLDFESLFLSGSEIALQHVARHCGGPVHWIGHSGGGLAALMLLARQPEYTAALRSLVLLGSQACEAGKTFTKRSTLRLFQTLTRLLGVVPGKRLGLGPENEVAQVMLQWYRWNLQGAWLGADDFNYREALAQNKQLASIPVLGIAGSGDRFIAPPAACQRLYGSLPGAGNSWLECGVKQGFSEDYSHARLISSRAAGHEIWPRIERFLSEVETLNVPA